MLRIALKRESSEGKQVGKKHKKSSTQREVLGAEELSDQSVTKELETLVFGGEDAILEELSNKFTTDSDDKKAEPEEKPRKAVWEDEDDNRIIVESKIRGIQKEDNYASQLRKKMKDKVGTPKWAQLDRIAKHDSDESDDEILRTSGNLLSSFKPLSSGSIDIRWCKDLNHDGWTKGIVKSVKFHPSSQVALVANCNGTVSLFQVDGKTNPKIQAVHFEKFFLESAHFTVDGEQIIVGSPEHHHLYYYDMMGGKIVKVPWARGIEHCSTQRLFLSPDGKYLVICGRFGEMHLLTVKSKEWVGSLKMNGEVKSVAFTEDGSTMYSHGENGDVFVWDVKSRKCLFKFHDEGCIKGTALALSPNGQYLATGSDSGVVNVYNTSDLQASPSPKPLKAVLNLTTDVTSLKFNHSSEVLAMASPYRDNAVKLLHVPTASVYSNFPLFNQRNLRRVNCLDTSLNSGYLVLGNSCGNACLFRMKHFSNY